MKLDRILTPQPFGLPNWVPLAVVEYLQHIVGGASIRSVARVQGHHASTVLRHVRHLENRRDDLLVDEALQSLTAKFFNASKVYQGDMPFMTVHLPQTASITEQTLKAEALRILRRLAESSSLLIIAGDLEKGAVIRESSAGHPIRTAIVERRVAQAFALKDWIECIRKGKIAQYQITVSGRAALKRLIAEQLKPEPANGMAEAPSPFREQHGEWETREFRDSAKSVPQKLRYNLADSPLTALGRRAGKDGAPFLCTALVAAGERLREDFELAQMGTRVTQNWDRFLTSGRSGDFGSDGPAEGPRAARERVASAIRDLGPGLGDIALRCCCFLEGLETAEKRMGWSARSGKIVLRIALQRLRLHYEQQHGNLKPMIG